MAQIKNLNDSASKWARRAGSASREYTEGVSNPRRDWEQATKAGEKNYEKGVQDAISRNAFGKGVAEAGTQKWQDRSVELGSARYSSGVQASENEYEQGFAPYHQRLASINLPPRGSKGSPENLRRVEAVANALRAEKVGK
ncbi:MAG: hypothetical protein ACE5HI_06680 [bacterium]